MVGELGHAAPDRLPEPALPGLSFDPGERAGERRPRVPRHAGAPGGGSPPGTTRHRRRRGLAPAVPRRRAADLQDAPGRRRGRRRGSRRGAGRARSRGAHGARYRGRRRRGLRGRGRHRDAGGPHARARRDRLGRPRPVRAGARSPGSRPLPGEGRLHAGRGRRGGGHQAVRDSRPCLRRLRDPPR